MDHSLEIRKDPERVWDVPGSEAGSRRDRGRVHHRMSSGREDSFGMQKNY